MPAIGTHSAACRRTPPVGDNTNGPVWGSLKGRTMATATAEPTVLDGLKDRRAEISVEWDKLIEDRESERQEFEARLSAEKDEEKPSEEEREAYKLAEEEFRTASDGFDGNYKQVDSRSAELQGTAERRKVAETHSVEVGDHISISEPLPYGDR